MLPLQSIFSLEKGRHVGVPISYGLEVRQPELRDSVALGNGSPAGDLLGDRARPDERRIKAEARVLGPTTGILLVTVRSLNNSRLTEPSYWAMPEAGLCHEGELVAQYK